MNKSSSIFGKAAIVGIIFAIVGFGAFYAGKRNKTTNSTTVSTQNKDQVSIEISPSTVQNRTVNGGVDKKAGLVFNQYSLSVPMDWNDKKESQTANDETLTLAKNGHEIKIFQAATGGAMCLYPGDADFEGPSSKYTAFKDLTTKDAILLRMSGTEIPFNGKIGFTACQKNTEGNYGQPTNYGHISYSLPEKYNQDTLLEMDAIISSLQKK